MLKDTLLEKVKDVKAPLLKGGRLAWLAGLGVVGFGVETSKSVFQTLVAKGEAFEADNRPNIESKGKAWIEKGKTIGGKVETQVQTQFHKVMAKFGIPSRNEIQDLTEKVDTLTQKLQTEPQA